jgi:hypothetical protein
VSGRVESEHINLPHKGEIQMTVLPAGTKITKCEPNSGKGITKKLEKLLLKYKKANQARLNAYNRRIQRTHWQWNLKEQKRIYPQNVTVDLIKELDANIKKARLYKLEVSKELRAYCKKKKYHIKWGPSNQIMEVHSHLIPKS